MKQTISSKDYDIEISFTPKKAPEIVFDALRTTHWGTATKTNGYSSKAAYVDLKNHGINAGNLSHVGSLNDTFDDHQSAFGFAPFGALASGPNEWWEITKNLEDPEFLSKLASVRFITLNSESKNGHELNQPLKDMITNALKGETFLWTHDQVYPREQTNPKRWDATTHASTWCYTYPNIFTPEWITADAACLRGTGKPLGYVVIQLIDYFDEFKLAPTSCIVRGAMLAALSQPYAVGYYGWWRVHNDPRARSALKLANQKAQEVHNEIAGWERVPSDVLLTYDRTNWGYTQSIALHQLVAALARTGHSVDVAPEDAIKNGNYLFVVPFSAFKYNKYMTYGRPYELDSRIHWRQDEAEKAADEIVSGVIDSYIVKHMVTTDTPTNMELFETGGWVKAVIVNTSMDYDRTKLLPQAAKTVPLARNVTITYPGGTKIVKLPPYGVTSVTWKRF